MKEPSAKRLLHIVRSPSERATLESLSCRRGSTCAVRLQECHDGRDDEDGRDHDASDEGDSAFGDERDEGCSETHNEADPDGLGRRAVRCCPRCVTSHRRVRADAGEPIAAQSTAARELRQHRGEQQQRREDQGESVHPGSLDLRAQSLDSPSARARDPVIA